MWAGARGCPSLGLRGEHTAAISEVGLSKSGKQVQAFQAEAKGETRNRKRRRWEEAELWFAGDKSSLSSAPFSRSAAVLAEELLQTLHRPQTAAAVHASKSGSHCPLAAKSSTELGERSRGNLFFT